MVAIVLGLVVAMGAVSATVVWASNSFADVPSSNFHHGNIGLIANAGITSGCQANPPEYCPQDPVTREQMATFMARLGGLGNHPPVADAATLEGFGKQNYVFGPDPDTTLVDQSTSFTLNGGAPSECDSTMAFTGQTDFRVLHQLHATPAGIEPWEINVQVANVSPPNYDVCFATLDGSNLPAGTYETYAMMLVYP
jgi:hypothetical protein